MSKRRVYGPVPSRRFGLSLGVDLVPHKTCCYDCVYCQLGKTTRLTVGREDFFPKEEILSGVEEALSTGPAPEVITLAGSGDPCLHRSLGRLIEGLHGLSDVPVVLLTNGALLSDQPVAQAALLADILAPSLDAGDEHTFLQINRPHQSIGFVDMLQGLQAVCDKHPGKVRLEVMLVSGMNDSDESIQRLAGQIGPIRTDSIDVNTPVRPAPGRQVFPSQEDRLDVALRAFGPSARIVAEYRGPRAGHGRVGAAERNVLDLLSRRPCTLEDIHSSLGLQRNEVEKILEDALKAGKLHRREGKGKTFYFAADS